jgi:hypothetical protein
MDFGVHYKQETWITGPKECMGSTEMCQGSTRHILDGRKAARVKKKEVGSTFVLLAVTTMWTYNVEVL